MDAFDLIQAPNNIRPNFVFDALFLAIGPSLLALAIGIVRRTERGRSDLGDRMRNLGLIMLPFSAVWIGLTCWLCGENVSQAYVIRSEVREGRYETLEGCLDWYHPGLANPGRTTAGDERWAVEGHEFFYRDGEIRFAYHAVEPTGGLVHADSWVEVSFVPNKFFSRDEIVRLRVKSHACKPASDLR